MYKCYKCSDSLQSIDLLCKHLKYLHGWFPGETLVCGQFRCFQKFSHLSRFKRHLANVHKNVTVQVVSDLSEKSNDFTACGDGIRRNDGSNVCNKKVHSENYQQVLPQTNLKSNEGELRNLRTCLDTFALKFVTQLYSLQGLTTPTCLNIMDEVQELVAIIVTSIRNYKRLCEDDKTNAIDTFLDFCENPFAKIRSEYLLFKELSNKGIYLGPKKFIINNHVGVLIENIYYFI